mgnify:CR=1 FL=1
MIHWKASIIPRTGFSAKRVRKFTSVDARNEIVFDLADSHSARRSLLVLHLPSGCTTGGAVNFWFRFVIASGIAASLNLNTSGEECSGPLAMSSAINDEILCSAMMMCSAISAIDQRSGLD